MRRPRQPRDHFVYRAYDEHGVLLYIGCTSNPRNRRNAHRSQSPWIGFMHRHVLTGPLPKDDAYALERRMIEDELPFFNRIPRRPSVSDIEFTRRCSEWSKQHPTESFDDFVQVMDRIKSECEDEFGHITVLDEYLEVRAEHEAVA